MVKLILVGVWVAIVALGSVYFSIQMSKAPDPAAEEAKRKALQELVRGEVTTFPVISDGKVQGYFLARTSYIVDKTKASTVTLPIPVLITDELYTALVGDKIIRLGENRNFDLKAFRERIKTVVNKRLEQDVVIDVLIEQVDYLSKEDIRTSMKHNQAPHAGQKIISEELPADLKDKPGAEAASH